MAKQELTHITLTERIIEAAAEIVAMHLRLPVEDARFLVGKVGRLTVREFGLANFPSEELPLAVKYQFVRHAMKLLAEELEIRKFDKQAIVDLLEDLDAFYRGVRRIPPGE